MSEDTPAADKPKPSTQDQRRRREDKLTALRLRMMIGRALEDRDIVDAAAIGATLGMPPVEATKLLTRRQWREGDVAHLTEAAKRLGLLDDAGSASWNDVLVDLAI